MSIFSAPFTFSPFRHLPFHLRILRIPFLRISFLRSLRLRLLRSIIRVFYLPTSDLRSYPAEVIRQDLIPFLSIPSPLFPIHRIL